MVEFMTLVSQIDNDKVTPDERKKYWGSIVKVVKKNGKEIAVYKDHPELEVYYKDLLRINESTYNTVMADLLEGINKTSTESKETVPVTPIPSPVDETPVAPEAPAAPAIPSTPDMLVNTGKTIAMSPITIDTPTALEVPEVNEQVQTTQAPTIERAKTKTMKKQVNIGANRQAGFVEAIVLGVVVLVYIAIIVNLIIRLK
jgi:hypothetical protein